MLNDEDARRVQYFTVARRYHNGRQAQCDSLMTVCMGNQRRSELIYQPHDVYWTTASRFCRIVLSHRNRRWPCITDEMEVVSRL